MIELKKKTLKLEEENQVLLNKFKKNIKNKNFWKTLFKETEDLIMGICSKK